MDVDFTGHKLVGKLVMGILWVPFLCALIHAIFWDINDDHGTEDFHTVITPRSVTPC
jgi:hypothetical protein